MAFEQFISKERKSLSAAAEAENISGCFNCNICLDFAFDPVVTLCGHLYCWPCIYKWFDVQSASLAMDENPRCPVCKAKVSHTTVVPLYGRGQTLNEAELEGKSPYSGMTIPPRPPACSTQNLTTSSEYSTNAQGDFEDDSSSPSFNIGGSTVTGAFHPAIGMFGEMVYARVFGNPESSYAYPNSYHLMGRSSPRLRRQEMQVDKSLKQNALESGKVMLNLNTLAYRYLKELMEAVDKIDPSPKGWKVKSLSMAGRTTLVKHVSQVIPSHVAASMFMPKSICNQIGGIVREILVGM